MRDSCPSSPVRCSSSAKATTPPQKTCFKMRRERTVHKCLKNIIPKNGIETLLLAAEHTFNEFDTVEDPHESEDRKKALEFTEMTKDKASKDKTKRIGTLRRVKCCNLDEAKQRTSTDDNAVGLSVENNEYFVYSKTFVDEQSPVYNETDIQWEMIKAWYPKIGRFVLAYVKGVSRIFNARGSIREIYFLPNNMMIKRHVQSCVQCDMAVCWNCQHSHWNAKCLTGLDYYMLSSRS